MAGWHPVPLNERSRLHHEGGPAKNNTDQIQGSSADRAVSDSGAVLEWVDAHRDQYGWHHGRWEIVERASTCSAPRARSVPVEFDRDVAQQLVSSPSFALAWSFAKDLAPLPARLARADLASSWGPISKHVDPVLVIETASMIRSAAIERYVESDEVARAVKRLLEDVERSAA